MTKKTLKTEIDAPCWIEGFDGRTVGEAITALQELDPSYIMKVDYGYDSTDTGNFFEVREETDTEYTARRLAEEVASERQREAERKAQEQLTERMMLIAAKDVAFKAYMEKHKDNPNIGDLSNLFMAAVALGKAGHDSRVVGPLLECMERLEKQ